jgi:hypothetical protein
LRETYEWQKSLHGETERLVDPEDKKMGVLG